MKIVTGLSNGVSSNGSEIPKTAAKLLMSKVRVLVYGDASVGKDASSGMNNARTAVLAVPTAQVDALTLAKANGHLTLALRSPRDEEVATQTAAIRVSAQQKDPSEQAAAGVTLSELSGGAADTAPRRAAPRVVVARNPGSSIEVIRGGQAETVAY
ncbi:MAG: hypothetical protein GAK40_01234 [Burkholderia plantarii]|nr:MAG: hypothetical protein GAK40_01234 [Burkholderia plantarii]